MRRFNGDRGRGRRDRGTSGWPQPRFVVRLRSYGEQPWLGAAGGEETKGAGRRAAGAPPRSRQVGIGRPRMVKRPITRPSARSRSSRSVRAACYASVEGKGRLGNRRRGPVAGSDLGVPFPFPLGMRLGGWPGPSSQRFAESETAVSLRCRDAQRHSARGRVDCEPLVCVAFPLSATSRSGASSARAEHLRIRGKDPLGAARSAAAAPPFGAFVISALGGVGQWEGWESTPPSAPSGVPPDPVSAAYDVGASLGK